MILRWLPVWSDETARFKPSTKHVYTLTVRNKQWSFGTGQLELEETVVMISIFCFALP